MKYLYISLLVFLSSCGVAEEKSKTLQYFDLDSFFEQVISELELNNPSLEKKWIFNQESEVKTVNDIDWKKEFKVFKDFDINKSSFITSFDSVITENTVSYILKPDESLAIKEISISYDPDGKPAKIKAYRETSNMFFTSSSNNEITFEESELSEYAIHSVQKLLWFESDSSSVFGKIIK